MATILVVDDESGIREFMADALSDAGHRVVQAENGREAIRHLQDEPFDLVVLDLHMPGDTGGLDVLRRARAEWPATQAIVLTAHGTVETAVEAMRLGAFDFLQKPISGPDELRRLVIRALNWRGSRARPLEDAPAAVPITPSPAPPRSALGRLLRELQRRHVYTVGATYLAVSFILLQGAQAVLPALDLPEGSYELLVNIALIGFPIAIVLGWAYDLTARGIRRSSPAPAPRGEPPPRDGTR